ncbi:hypothetical protein BGZ65_001805 [Modicella reniformis]|uniref:AIG1-type G domain-containing protein n=1 Tax=Modicella reniformis TaxID=1440133 RepID=A0A9P6MIK1_9FUNG|nr:hypothetical protein BGZ65_001805 [Modicella reniformis]
MSPVLFSAAALLSSTAAPLAIAGMGQYQSGIIPIAYGSTTSPSSGTEDDGVTTSTGAFVSSPISYQPPSNLLSTISAIQPLNQASTEGCFQVQYVRTIVDEGSGTSTDTSTSTGTGIGTGSESSFQSRSGSSHANPARNSLLLQQRYQQQQLAQFREELDACNRETNSEPSLSSTGDTSGSPGSGVHTSVILAASSSDSPIHQEHIQGEHRRNGGERVTFEFSESNRLGSAVGYSKNGHPSGVNGGAGGHGPGHVAIGSGGGSTFFPTPLPRASTTLAASHLITHDVRRKTQSHIIDGAGPVMLMAIGKTGQGKSSLLNKIMGTSELKASASVRAVTKGIAERTGWGCFEDSRRVLVTLADTPGLADTEGDDEKNIPILKEYIKSVGKRLGVTAFLLVFKIDSGVDMILTILTTFDDIMRELPDFWDNVILVFTGCDFRRNVMNTKQFYHDEIQRQLEERFFKERYNQNNGANTGNTERRNQSSISQESTSMNGSSTTIQSDECSPSGSPIVSMVFLTCAEAPCGFSLGEKCDCKARTTFLNAGLKRLWYAVRNKKRWVLEEDEDEDGLGHS